METRGIAKRKIARGRKVLELNRQADIMDEHSYHHVFHNVAQGGSANDDHEISAVANLLIPKAENGNTDNNCFNFLSDIDLTSNFHSIDNTSTEQILEEAEFLLAEFRDITQNRSNIMNGINQHGNSAASTSVQVPIVILDNIQTGEGSSHSNDSNSVTIVETQPIASTSSSANQRMDDSVVIVDDSSLPAPTRGNVPTVSDDIILIDDEPYEARLRITAIVDLCSPESSSSNRRKRQHTPPPLSIPAPNLNASLNNSMTVRGVTCPVCMDKIRDGQTFSTICGHIFCGGCIKRAVKARKKCPICNTNINAKGIHPLYFS